MAAMAEGIPVVAPVDVAPPMAQVVDAIDTVTRAASNLIFAYLQVNDL